jgi:DNA repair photolyase
MKWRGWEKIPLEIPDPSDPSGLRTVEAVAPVIISASRSTDIPAFYGDWFMDRLKAGYVRWKSPFAERPVYVSFNNARVFVFWSKNPAPFIPCLDELDRREYGYYFLYTLNDYDTERLEPNVPPLEERIATFIRLSQRIGKGRIVWRFDPLILSDTISVDDLLERVKQIGDRIAPFTRRLVFSFVDIEKYAKVRRNLKNSGNTGVREFTDPEVEQFCTGLQTLNHSWGLLVTACAERRDLTRHGIGRGQCISYDLLATEYSHDAGLMAFLRPEGQQRLDLTTTPRDLSRFLKDPGQRNTCRCVVAKVIGQYSTCMHLCAYCYANTSPPAVRRNYTQYLSDRERGIFHDAILG